MTRVIKNTLLFVFVTHLLTNTKMNITRVKRQTTILKLSSDKAGYPYSWVQVGGDMFKIMFDTGSCVRWVASSTTLSPYLGKKNKYDINSPSRLSLEQKHISAYVDGVQEGNLVKDSIFLAEQEIPEFLFVEMIWSTCTGMKAEEFDGIFGLRKSTGNGEYDDYFELSLLDHAICHDLTAEEMFSFRFCGGIGKNGVSWFEEGDLVFGSIEQSFYRQPMVSLPLYASEQWKIVLDSIQYGGITLCEPCLLLVDTGAPVTTIPETVAQTLLRHSPIKPLEGGALYIEPQDLQNVEAITITALMQPFKVPAHNLLMPLAGSPIFIFGMQYVPGKDTQEWTLGLSLLHNFYTVFDQGGSQVHLAAARC